MKLGMLIVLLANKRPGWSRMSGALVRRANPFASEFIHQIFLSLAWNAFCEYAATEPFLFSFQHLNGPAILHEAMSGSESSSDYKTMPGFHGGVPLVLHAGEIGMELN
jgi:hypothetical protein